MNLNKSSESVARAATVQLGSKCLNIVFQLVITMVLARLLTPAEYGTVAVLTVFTGFFSILADAGISTAVIQFRDLDAEDYGHLFFFSLVLGLALAAAFFVLSFGIAAFYGDTSYIPLGGLLTLSVLFNSLDMVPNGLLQKERKFTLIGFRLVVCTVTVGLAVIVLAFLGFGCYAIVLNSVLTSLFILIWDLLSTRLAMRFGDFRPTIKKVGSYSAFQFGHQAIVWFSGNLDSLLAGKLFGAEALGYYNKAYNLYGYPNSVLTGSITGTLVPFLSPYQNDVDAMCERFVGIAKKVSLLAAFCTVEMSLCATEIIAIMYGDVWAPAAPLLQILAIAIYPRGLNSAHAPLMSASNRTDLLMLSTLINTAVTVLMIFFGGLLGSINSLAICVAIAYWFELFVPVFLCARKCLGMNPFVYIRRVCPELLAAFIVLLGGLLIPWPALGSLALLVLKMLYCTIFYIALCCLFGQSKVIRSLLSPLWAKLRKRG